MRQLAAVGGLQGRPEKLPDVCYSWWVLASMQVLGVDHSSADTAWIDARALQHFILQCQDADGGGIADREGDAPDVFHTLFGMCGLSMTAYAGAELQPVDPVYCMPVSVMERVRASKTTRD